MRETAKKKAAKKWLAAEMKKKFVGVIAESLTENQVRAIVMETMSEAVPWMRDLLGKEFNPDNALEFFKLAMEDD